ncbi:hypothetical protein M2171_003018 [Bradyrhizobium japonicum USDA 38]|nr:hypothetical protein [Bradyrhizobium japonicum USDA 38]MCS3946399.1 hypothetical protein [Bradyrhizobium japonicum]MCW2221281.1 hypothetical protein [Bradyrhizobium japonicum]MCW2345893.1 hypothetical protein [Bradyrhizobium japonicum]
MLFKTRLRFNSKMRWLDPTPGNVRDTTCSQVKSEPASYTENWEQKFQKIELTEP